MNAALTISTNGLTKASDRFEGAAGRIVRGGAQQADTIQRTSGAADPGGGADIKNPGAKTAGGVQPIGQNLSNDMTSALIDLQVAQVDFQANARVMSKAYEMTADLLETL